MNNKQKGNLGEEMAAKYLRRHGYKILARQYAVPFGEIDIVCMDRRKTLVFTEVKTRSDARFGEPREAVTLAKQKTIARVAEMYMLENHIAGCAVRFDVVEILGDKLNHIVNAFSVN